MAHTALRGLAERTDVVGGDLFEAVPAADLYLLKFILHDWDDENCVKILSRCREAMLPGGRLAVIELVLGKLSDPGFGALMDMNMLAASPGQERSLDEYDALLAAAGLQRTAFSTVGSPAKRDRSRRRISRPRPGLNSLKEAQTRMTELDDQVVAEFRANAGVVLDAMGGHFSSIHLLLLHNTGWRTGKQYVTPLLYVEDGDRYVLIGSNGGAEKEPAWVANVAAEAEVLIEVGERMLTATPTILRNGAERDRLHAAAVADRPDILEYQTDTTRTFPLIVLNPVPDSARPNATRRRRQASTARARHPRSHWHPRPHREPEMSGRTTSAQSLTVVNRGTRDVSLNGKVAFVTGAARGQGRAHAVRLASEGADVVAVDLCDQIDSVPYPMANPDDLAATVKLVEDTGARIVANEADVRDRGSLTEALQAGLDEFGRLEHRRCQCRDRADGRRRRRLARRHRCQPRGVFTTPSTSRFRS